MIAWLTATYAGLLSAFLLYLTVCIQLHKLQMLVRVKVHSASSFDTMFLSPLPTPTCYFAHAFQELTNNKGLSVLRLFAYGQAITFDASPGAVKCVRKPMEAELRRLHIQNVQQP